MPFILIQVTIFNHSDFPIVWLDDGRDHGDWQDPWYPSNIKSLQKGEQASFRIESAGDIPILSSIGTGAQGWALFKVDVPPDPGLGDRTEYFTLSFDRPFIETQTFERGIDYQLNDPRGSGSRHAGLQMAYAVDLGTADMGNEDNVGEILGAIGADLETAGIGMFVEAPLLLLTDSYAKHVLWVVDVRNAGAGQDSFPLRKPDQGVLYAITRRTSEFGRLTSTDRTAGGDLNWYRHDGRLDGRFVWQGPDKVGVGWDGLDQVFSGGDGILYGITPRIDASLMPAVVQTLDRDNTVTPARGGDLLWYKHLGFADGTFQWDGPKVVGKGWYQLEHVFSGGDGILYGIDQNGNLQWYRHLGREDGSFTWEGPRTVGVGWGGLQRVFAGGNGIIYAVTASNRITRTGMRQAAAGDLLWFKHLGWQDGSFNWQGPKQVGSGWGHFEQLCCDQEGVLYAVTPHVDANPDFGATTVQPGSQGGKRPTPATGGDLLWYEHTGRDQGTWDWQGPKKVGVGWGGLKLVFSGGVVPV